MKLSVNHGIKSLLHYGEAHPAVIRGLSIVWLAVICWFAFLSHLGEIGLVDETEPLFAEAARQMTVTGDWVTPFFNGETRFDKPPLIYWLMAITYQLLGTNEWAVRLPSALAATALTCFGFYVIRRFGVPQPVLTHPQQGWDATHQTRVPHSRSLWQLELPAWLGAAMIALNIETIAWGRTGVSDMLLSGCLGAALLAFFMGYAQPEKPVTRTRWYLAFYILLALAVLTKGPIGIVLPGLIIGLFLLYLGNWRQVLAEMRLLLGSLIFLALTVPWYVLVIQANGQAYIQSFFGYHNFERFTSVVNRHDAPWYFYLLIIAVGFAPWSIYLPAAIARLRVWRRPYWQTQPRSTHLGLFAFAWVLGIFGFFTLAVTKLPSYLLPLMPGAAILVALVWSQPTQSPSSKPQNQRFLSGWLNVLLFLVFAGAFLYSPNWLNDDATLPNLRLQVQQAGLPVIGAAIWGLAALAGIVLLLKRQARWLWSVNFIAVLASLMFLLMPSLLILDAERQLPLRQLATIAVQAQRPGEELVMLGFKKPSLVFYTQQHITYLEDPQQARSYLRPIVTAPSHTNSALVIALDQDFLRAGLKSDDYQNLAEATVYRLVRVAGPNSAISSQSTSKSV